MRLTFLGTGSAMPTGERYQTGLLLEEGDRRLLVDCGSGALHGLATTDAGYEGIDGVLLTHHHLDHVSDLMPLLKARWLAGASENDGESFPIAGPPGTRDLVEGLFSVHEYMQDRLDLDVREVEPGGFSIAGLDVEATKTRHSIYCLAYRFSRDGAGAAGGGARGDADADESRGDEDGSPGDVDGAGGGEDGTGAGGDEAGGSRDDGGDLTFSGDTEAFEDVAAFADGSAVLVHDCSFPDDVDVSNHPTPSQLGAVLAGREFGTVYLTHLYPHTDGRHEEMLASLGEHYDGDVRFARDGLSIEV